MPANLHATILVSGLEKDSGTCFKYGVDRLSGLKKFNFGFRAKGFLSNYYVRFLLSLILVRLPHVEFANGIDRSAYSIALNKDISVNASTVCFAFGLINCFG